MTRFFGAPACGSVGSSLLKGHIFKFRGNCIPVGVTYCVDFARKTPVGVRTELRKSHRICGRAG